MNGPGGPASPRPAAIEGGLGSCWFCGRGVSPRALFCHGCGSVQPPAALDSFTRLGISRRYDLDLPELDRQTLGFLKVLDADRFESRGLRERQMAERHREAITAARAELKDPIRRGLLLLQLAGQALAEFPVADPWTPRVAAAETPAEIDGLAGELTREQQATLKGLSRAFLTGELDRAALLLARLQPIQAALATLRPHRRRLSPEMGPGETELAVTGLAVTGLAVTGPLLPETSQSGLDLPSPEP